MAVTMQVRRGTAAAWTAANPILLSGEIGYETDTGSWKVGDGATSWTSLTYASGRDGGIGGPWDPGSFSVASANYRMHYWQLRLTSTNRATLIGTSTLLVFQPDYGNQSRLVLVGRGY